MLRFFVFFLVLCSVLCGCGDRIQEGNGVPELPGMTDDETLPSDTLPYFKATGTEPFWGVSVSTDKIVFTSLIEGYDRVEWTEDEPEQAQDADISLYRAKGEMGELSLEVKRTLCVNAMSGDSSDYSVELNISKTESDAPISLEGCGDFIPDYRLHDIWVLEQIGGHPVTEANCRGRRPYVEVNTQNKTFLGYTGCNDFRGRIDATRDRLRWEIGPMTKVFCGQENCEQKFLIGLESATHFEIKENRLFLSNPDSALLIFRHVD